MSKLREVSGELLYAGGVRDCGDVELLASMGFDGVVVGYALHRGDLTRCVDWL